MNLSRPLSIIALMAAVAVADPAAAQTGSAVTVTVTWQPDTPVVGTLFRVRVRAPVNEVRSVAATVAGEPLHFVLVADTIWESFAAAPIDAGTSLIVPLTLSRQDGTSETVEARLTLAGGAYRLEKLTVAPAFGTPYDSATLARIRSEQAKAATVSRNTHATPRLWSDVVHPRDTRVTSGFGHGREFNGQVQSRHMGTDFAGTTGAPVRAAARGVVALVESFFLAGNAIYIDHGAGLVTAYFHLSRQDVAVGDTVEAGQIIGQVGATGRVTGPHLHWVVRYGSITIDPLSFLALTEKARPDATSSLPPATLSRPGSTHGSR